MLGLLTRSSNIATTIGPAPHARGLAALFYPIDTTSISELAEEGDARPSPTCVRSGRRPTPQIHFGRERRFQRVLGSRCLGLTFQI
jgi:hypothetical protein